MCGSGTLSGVGESAGGAAASDLVAAAAVEGATTGVPLLQAVVVNARSMSSVGKTFKRGGRKAWLISVDLMLCFRFFSLLPENCLTVKNCVPAKFLTSPSSPPASFVVWDAPARLSRCLA